MNNFVKPQPSKNCKRFSFFFKLIKYKNELLKVATSVIKTVYFFCTTKPQNFSQLNIAKNKHMYYFAT